MSTNLVNKTTTRTIVIITESILPPPPSVRRAGFGNRWRSTGMLVASHEARWSKAKEAKLKEALAEFIAEFGGTASDHDLNSLVQYADVWSKADVTLEENDPANPGRIRVRVNSDRDGGNNYDLTANRLRVVEL